ncbi:hypothetical protein Ddye_025006 [Dipteronia dyeriana]|uniref:RNase H type-1 domain-containing protein n=1 Tax=Dipteronia dyeriana TaxID=168575 RepID=A0AAD9TWI1_9ROSI|nr:hypothetical protein Ddye_025006 [Dipteronia dyeriana]
MSVSVRFLDTISSADSDDGVWPNFRRQFSETDFGDGSLRGFWLQYPHEFKSVNGDANNTGVEAGAIGRLNDEKWNPPGAGLYKLNTDAALLAENCSVGVGVVIRNEGGLVMAATTQRIEATYVLEVAEAVAMLRGITLAVYIGLVPVIIESDHHNLVRKVVDMDPTDVDIGLVVNDILFYILNRTASLVSYVSRKANKVAHSLAKMALAITEDRFWLEEVPPSMELIVLEDVPD